MIRYLVFGIGRSRRSNPLPLAPLPAPLSWSWAARRLVTRCNAEVQRLCRIAGMPILQAAPELRSRRNEDDADVHHVGAGQASDEQIPHSLKEVVSIVARQEVLRREAQAGRAGERAGVGDGPGSVGRAVLAIRAATQ